ncbi:hypothetical protein FQN49_001365 [Arthroderma sp. PD_2]|nr:hypothetical protein FQN49_001365 [Arthroderma sp. PD_2]
MSAPKTPDTSGGGQRVFGPMQIPPYVRPPQGKSLMEQRAQEHIISRFMDQTMSCMKNLRDAVPNSSFDYPAYPPCTRPLCDLRKIMTGELSLDVQHKDSYLLLRSITPPVRINAAMAIMEDENSDVILVQLHHQDHGCDAADILPEGSIWILKGPFFRAMAVGEYGISVDHVSDAIHLPIVDRRVPAAWRQEVPYHEDNAISWNEKACNLVHQSKLHSAIGLYTKALECSTDEEETSTIRLNRALAFTKAKQFDAAILDAECASISPSLAQKSFARKARALKSLKLYRECQDWCQYAGLPMIRGIRDRLVEEEEGKYQFKDLVMEALGLRPPYSGHGTYVGDVCFRRSSHNKRGLFTTKAVKAGDLLLCEMAFAQAFADATARPSGSPKIASSVSPEKAEQKLLTMTVQKIYRNPSLSGCILGLCMEPASLCEVDGAPVVDTFLVADILSSNAFACIPTPRAAHMSVGGRKPQRSKWVEKKIHSYGLWPIASHIHHSCYNNTQCVIIGNMMIVRAARDLAPHTELTQRYLTPKANGYEERRKLFQKRGFECNCAICQKDKETPQAVVTRRNTLRAEVMEHFANYRRAPDAAVRRISTIIAEMTSTYNRSAFRVPRMNIWDIQLPLAELYARQRNDPKAAACVFAALRSLGYMIEGDEVPPPLLARPPLAIRRWGLIEPRIIRGWIILYRVYKMMKSHFADIVVKYAKITYRICMGQDDTFYDSYGHCLRGFEDALPE